MPDQLAANPDAVTRAASDSRSPLSRAIWIVAMAAAGCGSSATGGAATDAGVRPDLTAAAPRDLGGPEVDMAAPAPRWRLVVLDTFGGSASGAFAINEAGRAVGYALDQDEAFHPFVFDGQKMTRLPVDDAWAGGFAYGINADGAVAGDYRSPDGRNVRSQGVVWSAAGVATPLPPIVGYPSSSVFSITDDGTLSVRGTSADYSQTHVFVGPAGGLRELNLRYPINYGFKIARGGLMPGYSTDGVRGYGWFLDTGSFALTMLTPLGADSDTQAIAATASGKRYGYSYDDKGENVVRWTGGSTGDILRQEVESGWLCANDELVVSSYSADRGAPLLLRGGRWELLADSIEDPGAFQILDALDISDRGDIVGNGLDGKGQRRGFVLYRLPTP